MEWREGNRTAIGEQTLYSRLRKMIKSRIACISLIFDFEEAPELYVK
jgi:hypothetical protein